jgi:hypothetical protein
LPPGKPSSESKQTVRFHAARVNRVTLILRQSLPVFLSKRTISEACLPSSIIGFFHGAFQPHLDQMQHAPINDPARYRL